MALEVTSFATPEQMANRSEGAIPSTHQFLESELRAATRQIRNACRWHIAGREAIRYRKVRPFSEGIWLPAMEIQSIDSGTIDGVAVTSTTTGFDPDTGWTPLKGCDVDITFTAGFDDIPDDLVTLTLELAAGALGSPLGISREQAGAVSISYTRTSGKLTADDMDRLMAYRLGWVP